VSAQTAILAYLRRHGSATGRELRDHLGVSRQALNVHIRALIGSGAVAKAGSTRGARYYAAERAAPPAVLTRRMRLLELDEDRVYEDVRTTLNLERALRPNVAAIVHYAFTEMLNNAIEHSGAPECTVRVQLEPGALSFEIRDRGIGAFASIAAKHGLPSEHDAMIELVKGKTTTMPEAHTGEGIFFTSKAADRFVLRSHRIQLEWDRLRDDVFVSEQRSVPGTNVRFAVRRDARTRLENVFNEYAPSEYDYRFEKTRVFVKLTRTEYISRSEAKRLTAGLDKFTEVELDFKGVKQMGQAFADEVFRVFASRHPRLRIHPRNASPAIDAMIRHAQRREP
jgi:anti-sigma regulatory factor (Ser/Thr protein kinase)